MSMKALVRTTEIYLSDINKVVCSCCTLCVHRKEKNGNELVEMRREEIVVVENKEARVLESNDGTRSSSFCPRAVLFRPLHLREP